MNYLRRLLGLTAPESAGRGAMEALEPRAMLAADLSLTSTNVSNFFDRRSSADRIQLNIAVTNVGTETYRNRGNVELFLSTDTTFDSDDARFATLAIPSVQVGQRRVLSVNVLEPKDVNPPSGRRALEAGTYNVIARISGLDGNAANDTVVATGTVDINYDFGTGEGGVRVPLTVPLPDGTSITLRINGTGSGSVRNDDGRTIVTLNAGGSRSELLITSNARSGQSSTINGLEINSVIKRVIADRIVVNGNVNVTGGVGFFSIGGLTSGTLLWSGTNEGFFLFSSPVVALGTVRDAIVSADVPFNSFDVRSWVDTNGGGDLLSVPSIITFSSGGDFQPSVTLTSQNDRGQFSVEKVSVRGRVSGSWRLASGVRRLEFGSATPDYTGTIGGTVEFFSVTGNFEGLIAATQINRIFVGGNIRNGRILAGAQLGNDVLLGGTGSDADSYRASVITEITVRGSVTNSLIAAGIRSTDNQFLNSDDTFATGTSRIGRIQVYREVTNSFFVAPSFPTTVRVRFNNNLPTANNPAFVTTLPITT